MTSELGSKIVEVDLLHDFTEEELKRELSRSVGLDNDEFTYQILRQSFDGRQRTNLHWKLRAAIFSNRFTEKLFTPTPMLDIPKVGRGRKVLVVGSGPAGYFSALFLTRAGFSVRMIEQGPETGKRWHDVVEFEKGGEFVETSNYACGEGGAGTFSDGKLTSRTKGIHSERDFIFDTYIAAGAPEEIAFLANPHLGSNRLRGMMPRLRKIFQEAGGEVLFNCTLTDITTSSGAVQSARTSAGDFDTDFIIIACGHSCHPLYEWLMRRDVNFVAKPFAVGMRVELPQETVNQAIWGYPTLDGMKAAEFALTAKLDTPVYSFCMCPGGRVVPAMSRKNTLVMNGVSDYERNGEFANAAIVAGVRLEELLGRPVSAQEALEWRKNIDSCAFDAVSGPGGEYAAPANRVHEFVQRRVVSSVPESTYPFPLVGHSYEGLLPEPILKALREGMDVFADKIHGFEDATIIGIETTTSSPVQVVRDAERRCRGFSNLYVAGEMSGFSGGIVSSAVDGIRAAQSICRL